MSSSNAYGYEDDPIVQTSTYTHDISKKMQVPKHLRATGEYDDELYSNQNGNGVSAWNYQNKLDMNVPDRIVVLGQDQHLVLTSGTKSAPREIMFDNSVLPKDITGFVRVQTPPRNITMAEHRFPAASDEPQFDIENDIDEYEKRSVDSVEERGPYGGNAALKKYKSHRLDMSHRDDATPLNSSIENLTPLEEVLYLKRQVTKLNRRVLEIEIANNNQKQRDTLVYFIGISYFVFKALMWFARK